MAGAGRGLADWKWRALSVSPRLYCEALRRTPANVQVVDERTHLVLEGFPRSANSFLRESVAAADGSLRIASHVHQAPHVRRAVAMGKPTVVVVREPLPAVVSMLLREPERRAKDLLQWYVSFHRGSWRVVDRIDLVGFEAATRALPEVLALVSARIGRPLAPPASGHEERVFAKLDSVAVQRTGSADEHFVARPSAEKQQAAGPLTDQLRSDPGLAPLIADAERWYARYRDRPGIW